MYAAELRQYLQRQKLKQWVLEYRYRSTQKRNKNGTFAYEGKKDLTTDKKGVIINSLEFIESLRGVGKRYPVRTNDNGKFYGDHCQLDTEKDIEQAHAFMGKGTGREIRDKLFLEAKYRIPANEWQKCAGFGYVIIDNVSVREELHWYQARGIRVDLKIKPNRSKNMR